MVTHLLSIKSNCIICSSESLRISPSLGFLMRKSVTEYKFPGSDLTIDKGTIIIIPTDALHKSEIYFEKPEEFRPERFHPDNIGKIKNCVYMPFGEGPRACIGKNFEHLLFN